MSSYFSALLRRASNRRTYASLLALDDRLLADMGLTRNDLHQMMAGTRTASKIRTHE
jgi:uncharacterized protein YjiS (DUF1127 family)